MIKKQPVLLLNGLFMKNYLIIAAYTLTALCISCRKATGEENPVLQPTTKEKVSNKTLRFHREKTLGTKDTISFESIKGSLANIALSVPKDSGNIRINQIIAPDGTADGPFGKTYTDTLSLSGTYLLIIGSSLMQEQPYEGAYNVTISLKK